MVNPAAAALMFVFAWIQVDSRSQEPEFERKYGPVIGITLIHRHGARTIDKYMVNDPYAWDTYWPEGIGELTKEGILQHYQQGQWIAEEYRHLIPRDWMDIKTGIRVYSTDWNRTIMSAEAELAGMFLLSDDDSRGSWHGLHSYLVPVHTIPENDDALLEVTKPCPSLKRLLNQNIKGRRYQNLMHRYKKIAKKIKDELGEKIYDLDNYQQVDSILSIERGRGLKLGKWTKEILPDLHHLARISFAAPTWTKKLKRLRGGPMIKEFIKNIDRKIYDPMFRSVSIYSAHDTSISAFLNSLNDLFTKEKLGPPPFAALVIIEHRQTDMKNFVRILYRCPYSEEESPDCHRTPRVLTIPKCKAFCPLHKVKSILHDVIPQNWERECSAGPDVDDDTNTNGGGDDLRTTTEA